MDDYQFRVIGLLILAVMPPGVMAGLLHRFAWVHR
jgi:hypothetical protein